MKATGQCLAGGTALLRGGDAGIGPLTDAVMGSVDSASLGGGVDRQGVQCPHRHLGRATPKGSALPARNGDQMRAVPSTANRNMPTMSHRMVHAMPASRSGV
jgi:hypothetical protein